MKWDGETGVLASEAVSGKNTKTFQFLSFSFIGSQASKSRMRGDPKISAHPLVNSGSGARNLDRA
jgi:hypothetical protein